MQVIFKDEAVSVEPLVQINEKLDEFIVVDAELNEVKSNELKGIKLILTVPSVDTSVCSMELSKFIDYMKNKEATLLSVSCDLPFALNRWCQSHQAENIIAASDFRYHDFERISGLLMKQVGLFARSVMIVDSDNVIRYLEIVEDVSHEPDYDKVIEALNQLS